MTEIAKDILNLPLRVGDVIAYPVRHGSCMDMHFGKIYSLEYFEPEKMEYVHSNYVRPGYWNCKIIIVSESSFCPDWDWVSEPLKKFITDQISSGNVPENLDYCSIGRPRKTPVGLDRAIKINSDHLSDFQKKVMLDEEWAVQIKRLKE